MPIHYSIVTKDNALIHKIQSLLDEFDDSRLLSVNDSYHGGLNDALRLGHDLIFVDIDTFSRPFHFVKEIKSFVNNRILFVALSRSKKSAYKAIKSEFIDYILLPLVEVELRKSMLNYQRKFSIAKSQNICLTSSKDFHYLNVNDIVFLKADNNATDFHMVGGQKITLMKTLKIFEDKLPCRFLRIHRSYIINSDYITKIDFSKCVCFTRDIQVRIPFTKSFKNNIDCLYETLTETSTIWIN